MNIRFRIVQIIGLIFILFPSLTGAYLEFLNVSLPFYFPWWAWTSLLILGLYFWSVAEAGALRARHKDKAETISKKELFTGVGIAVFLFGVVVCLAK